MKIKESQWHEAAKADRNEQLYKSSDAARSRQTTTEQANQANRNRTSDSPSKDETKFASLLESSAKAQKNNQRQEESGEDRREDRRREKKNSAADKDLSDQIAANDGKAEKNEAYGGQTGSGGQSGFGANINQLNLSESFAARSILHIADLERLVSTVRSQIKLGGRREIVLQMKRSVLEGLQVKITTDPETRVQIEFLAANEKMRSQIEEHSPELAEILRGRGVNLSSLTASLGSGGANENASESGGDVQKSKISLDDFDSSADNTFSDAPVADKIYQA